MTKGRDFSIKICLPIEDAYEEIASVHWSNDHAKDVNLQKLLKEKFSQSVIFDMVKWFVKCCPVCGITDAAKKMQSGFEKLKFGLQNISYYGR